MTDFSVLLVGSKADDAMFNVVFDAGYTPVVRETIPETMAELRREEYQAVIVDCSRIRVDVLELVLNIRDIAPDMRIFVLDNDIGGSDLLESPGVSKNAKTVTRRKLHSELASGKRRATASRAKG